MPQDRLCQLTIAGGTVTFLWCIFVDREPWRIDSEFDELTGPDMPLDDIGRDVEVAGVLCVHGDPAHQLVAIGEVLGVELILKLFRHVVALLLCQCLLKWAVHTDCSSPVGLARPGCMLDWMAGVARP